jgi:hypothetical protein
VSSGGPTIGGEDAAALVRELGPLLVVPMHYRTPAVNFLEPPDDFLAALGTTTERLDASDADADALLGTRNDPTVALFAPPLPWTKPSEVPRRVAPARHSSARLPGRKSRCAP